MNNENHGEEQRATARKQVLHWQEMADMHAGRVKRIVEEYFPSGSGFDNGTKIELMNSTPDKLIFQTAFHHMNGNGFYTEWTHHEVTVTPSLAHGFTTRVSGPNKDDIKDMIHSAFHDALVFPVHIT